MTLLYNADILNDGKEFIGYVVIEGQDIIRVGEGSPSTTLMAQCDKCDDIGGDWLIPGAIDVHVHFRQPGLTHKADIHSESRAALAGGVTSYLEMPNTSPQTVTIDALEEKRGIAAKDSAVNWGFFIGATNDNMKVLRDADYSRIPGIKMFMGSSTGNMLVDREASIREVFSMGHLVAVHCEDEKKIRENISLAREEWGDDVPVGRHPYIRSREACILSTRYALKIAGECGTRLHVCHLTTAEELEMIKDCDNVTAEASVAHLWFSDKDYPRKGALIKCNPAIKSEQDCEALRKGVAEGTVSIVATDHAPHLKAEKEGGALKAVSGMPSVQFSVPAMFTLGLQGVFPLTRIPEVMSHNPARRFRIEKRGFLKEGYRADIAIIGKESFTVTPEMVVSKCGWSPFEGEEFRAKVKKVYVNGRLSFESGRIISCDAEELRFGE